MDVGQISREKVGKGRGAIQQGKKKVRNSRKGGCLYSRTLQYFMRKRVLSAIGRYREGGGRGSQSHGSWRREPIDVSLPEHAGLFNTMLCVCNEQGEKGRM